MVSGALHHVGYAADDPRWELLAQALAPGDVALLLDRAARDASACARRIAALAPDGVRWCLPQVERASAPAGIEAIADSEWWQLIARHEVILEWS